MTNPDRKKAIWQVAIFCMAVTALAFLGPVLGGSPSAPGLGFILWGTAPMLVAIVMRLVTRDWSDAGINPAIRKNAAWYVLSILTVPVIMLLTLQIGTIFSFSSVSNFSLTNYLQKVLPGLVVFFIFAVFEEFGWRGYLAPKLASIGINQYLAYAIIAVVWATWHMPYIRDLTWVYSSGDLAAFIPRYYLLIFAYSILWNESRLVTGSVWPAVLMHCLTNAVQHPLDANYLVIAPGMEYLVSFNGFIAIALAGLVGIALNEWRSRQPAATKM